MRSSTPDHDASVDASISVNGSSQSPHRETFTAGRAWAQRSLYANVNSAWSNGFTLEFDRTPGSVNLDIDAVRAEIIADEDLDGFWGNNDDCPGETGFVAHGCPDPDNDGLINNLDACDDVPGNGSNGCPWTSRTTSAVTPTGDTYAFAIGTDGELWVRKHSSTWQSWQSLGFPPGYRLYDGRLSSVVASNGTVHVFVVDDDGGLYRRTYGANCQCWQAWDPLEGGNQPSLRNDDITSVVMPNSSIHVFAIATDGRLMRKTFGVSCNCWQAWDSLGKPDSDGVMNASLSSLVASTGAIHVFAADDDGKLWHKRYTNGWQPWEVRAGASLPMLVPDGITSVITPTNSIHTFSIDNQGSLQKKSHGTSGWQPWVDLASGW